MKKVMIVFEETDAAEPAKNGGFKVYLDGDISRIGKTDVNHLTAAEFWGLRGFQIVAEALKKSGAIQTMTKKASPPQETPAH